MTKMFAAAALLAVSCAPALAFETSQFTMVGPLTCKNLTFNASPTIKDCTAVFADASGCRFTATVDNNNRVTSRTPINDADGIQICSLVSQAKKP